MKSLVIVSLCLSCCCLAACADEGADDAYVTPPEEAALGTLEERRLLEESMAEDEQGFDFPAHDDDSPRFGPAPSGEWRKRDGGWECDGFLTREKDEVHCSATIPDAWVPFELDGKTFYGAPLSVDD